MVQVLVELMVEGREPHLDLSPKAGVVYQHVRVAHGAVEVAGEHVMAGARPLTQRAGFFGASDALTDYADGATDWVATLVFRRRELSTAREAAATAITAIAATFGLGLTREATPFAPEMWASPG